MKCADNRFCKGLPPQSRERLCANCRMKLFASGSVQLRGDVVRTCTLVIDGLLTTSLSFDREDIDHATDSPAIFLGLPGRLILPDSTLSPEATSAEFSYNNWHYPVDTWVASFDWDVVLGMLRSDPAFAEELIKSATVIQGDMCQFAALFRANYTYYGIKHLLSILSENGVYLTQSQIAAIMNHDRTAISKTYTRIKKDSPDLWASYLSNKNRDRKCPARPHM